MSRLTIDSVTNGQLYTTATRVETEFPCAISENDDGYRIMEIFGPVYAGKESSSSSIIKNVPEIINIEKKYIKEGHAPESNVLIFGDGETVPMNEDPQIFNFDSFKSVKDIENGITGLKTEILSIDDNTIKKSDAFEDQHSRNFEDSDNEKGINSFNENTSTDGNKIFEANKFVCDYCNKVFQRKPWFIEHIVSHQQRNKKNTKKQHSCSTCNKLFSSKSDLINHEVLKHESVSKYYSCPDCNYKTTTSRYKLALHMSTHVGLRRFNCEICSYKTNYKSNLTKHILTHTGDRPHKCTKCDACFIQSAHLRKHMNAHNKTNTSEIRTYSCEYCAYSSWKSCDIEVHSRIHTGEKPFQCGICDTKFARKNGLTRHLKIHMNKFHKCTTCGAQYKQLRVLKRHLRTHTGEKPYKCSDCEYSSVNNYGLKRHMKTHAKKLI